MRTNALKIVVVLCLLVALLPALSGCKIPGGKMVLPFGAGVIVGYLLGAQSESTTVERFCYENGNLVDCSAIPER